MFLDKVGLVELICDDDGLEKIYRGCMFLDKIGLVELTCDDDGLEKIYRMRSSIIGRDLHGCN